MNYHLPITETLKLPTIKWVKFKKLKGSNVFNGASEWEGFVKVEVQIFTEYIYIIVKDGIFFGAKVVPCNNSLTNKNNTGCQRL